jgi:hypothetical protein
LLKEFGRRNRQVVSPASPTTARMVGSREGQPRFYIAVTGAEQLPLVDCPMLKTATKTLMMSGDHEKRKRNT